MERLNRFLMLSIILLVSSCTNTNLIDVNVAIPENNWTYSKSVKATVEIKDPALAYNVFFKIRNTADYRYSNIYVIMQLKGVKEARYQFQLSNADGRWLGKGSGDLYSNVFPLLKKFHFPKAGKYELKVEQNMRDNPLVGISDVGLSIESTNKD